MNYWWYSIGGFTVDFVGHVGRKASKHTLGGQGVEPDDLDAALRRVLVVRAGAWGTRWVQRTTAFFAHRGVGPTSPTQG